MNNKRKCLEIHALSACTVLMLMLTSCNALRIQTGNNSTPADVCVDPIKRAITFAFSDDVEGRLFEVFTNHLSSLSADQRRMFVRACSYLYWRSEGCEDLQCAQIRLRSLAILSLPFSFYAREEAKRIALYSSCEREVNRILHFDFIHKDVSDYAFWMQMKEVRPELSDRITLTLGLLTMLPGRTGRRTIFEEMEKVEIWDATDRIDRMNLFEDAWMNDSLSSIAMFDSMWHKVYEDIACLRALEMHDHIDSIVPGPFIMEDDELVLMREICGGVEACGKHRDMLRAEL